MRPAQLSPAAFSAYPPQARALAANHVGLLQQLPLAFLPLLLRELIAYDWRFPAERAELDQQLAFLDRQAPEQMAQLMSPFQSLKVSGQLEAVDWVNVPAEFSEQLSAYLWSTGQIEAFRTASIDYVHRLNLGQAVAAPPLTRLTMVLVGKGAPTSPKPLFRKLRPYGVHLTNVDPKNGAAALFSGFGQRAEAHPAPYAHWYIEGGDLETRRDHWTCISYNGLHAVRKQLLSKMTAVMQPGGGGPELLRSQLQRMRPEDVGFPSDGDAVLSRFQLSLLTEGSGTQLFSTSFVQWAAREALRRAQPWTLLVRFTPRQRSTPIEGFKAGDQVDPLGSLVDADMGAYYTWINQGRLPSPTPAGFFVWYEDHPEAMAIGASFRAGTEENRPMTLPQILASFA